MTEFAGQWGVKCNVRAVHRFLRMGAMCWVVLQNPGWGDERITVWGMSRGGRKVRTWVDTRDMHNFRPAQFDHRRNRHALAFNGIDDAQGWAEAMNLAYCGSPVRPFIAARMTQPDPIAPPPLPATPDPA